MTGAITLQAPDPGRVFHEQTFTISDGVDEVTFQFLDSRLPGGGGGVPVYFYGADYPLIGTLAETRGQMADIIAAAINGVPLLDVTATSIATSERVDLFGAAWVIGIDQIVFGGLDVNIAPQSRNQPHRRCHFPWRRRLGGILDGRRQFRNPPHQRRRGLRGTAKPKRR
jgi:hypothetical protein